MRRVLVPVDFSSDSINAFEHALIYAQHADADIRMIHVSKNNNFDEPFNLKEYRDLGGRTIEDFFDIIINKYKAKIPNKIDYKIRTGKVYIEVCNQAKYDDSNLIIAGTHGISGFEEYWMGSNAFKIVSNAPCPVITIRNGYIRRELKTIVMPIDVSKDTRRKVNYTIDIAKTFNSEIHIIGVRETNKPRINKKVQNYVEQVSSVVEKNGVKYKTEMLLAKNITDTIIDYAKEHKAELISAMTEQAESAFNIFLGKYAQQLVNHSPIPVLSIRPNY